MTISFTDFDASEVCWGSEGHAMKLLQVVLFAQPIDDLLSRRHDDFLHICIFAVTMQIVDVPVASLRVFSVLLDSRWTPPGRVCIGIECF